MDNQTEIREYAPSPLTQVRAFVTRVWEHPLVDEETRRHREQAKTKFSDILQRFGVDPNTFITIPVGSLIWATDNKSDFDYQLVFKSMEDLDKLIALTSNQQTCDEMAQALEEEKINIVANFPCTADYFIKSAANCANFLFTPDDYIGGNIALAKQLRQEAVEQMINQRYSQSDWEWVVGHRFDIFFRKWDDLSLHLSWQYKSNKPDIGRERTQRIQERLERRARQTHKPSVYKVAFEKARNELKLPNFETYSQAIVSSQGELNLLPRFAATGIDNNLQV